MPVFLVSSARNGMVPDSNPDNAIAISCEQRVLAQARTAVGAGISDGEIDSGAPLLFWQTPSGVREGWQMQPRHFARPRTIVDSILESRARDVCRLLRSPAENLAPHDIAEAALQTLLDAGGARN